jgi:hypothetical protein
VEARDGNASLVRNTFSVGMPLALTFEWGGIIEDFCIEQIDFSSHLDFQASFYHINLYGQFD